MSNNGLFIYIAFDPIRHRIFKVFPIGGFRFFLRGATSNHWAWYPASGLADALHWPIRTIPTTRPLPLSLHTFCEIEYTSTGLNKD